MANRGVNIQKVPIDPEALQEELKAAGYSIRAIAKVAGSSDRTFRYYLKRNEMPVVIMNRVYAVLGKKHIRRMVDADVVIKKLKEVDKAFDKLGYPTITIGQVHKLLDRTMDFIEKNTEEIV